MLWLRADWDAIDLSSRRPGWGASAFAEVRKGLDIFDATDGCNGLCPPGAVPTSRIDGEANATVLRAGGEAELALGKDFAIAVSAHAFNMRSMRCCRSRNSRPEITRSAAATTRRPSAATAASA